MRTSMWLTRGTVVGLATAATLSWTVLSFGQEKQPGERPSQGHPAQPTAHERETAGGVGASGGGMTAEQAAALIQSSKQSLADSISAAEKHCGGKAVRAECCYRSAAAGGTENGTGGRVCRVTVVVGDNRLVEATVDTESGKVIDQHDVAMVGSPGMGRMQSSGRQSEFAMAERWQKASDLRGKRVTNDKGEDLGRLEDIVTDANSGRILYGVLSFGGFLGLGDKYFAIPWASLELSGDAKALVLNVDRDRLIHAEGFPRDHWPNFADEQFATNTYKYYDQTPPGQTRTTGAELASDANRTNDAQRGTDAKRPADGNRAARADEARPGTSESYRARWNERMTSWEKASDLSGRDVRTADTSDVGKLTDLAIDPDGGRILYGVLAYRGKLFAIPWSALTLSSDKKHLVLNADKDLLSNEMAFTKDTWPNLADSRVAMQLYEHYRVEPYWTPQRGGEDGTANRNADGMEHR